MNYVASALRPVGLVDNSKSGKPFNCGHCTFFDEKNARCDNSHPKLKGRSVMADWCCNLYDHVGMKTIIR